MYNEFKNIIGRKIKRIFMDENNLVFETDNGKFAYWVDGDCCSHSYFHDFVGVKKLLENGPIRSVEAIHLEVGKNEIKDDGDDCIECYGYRFTTENPQFGEQSSVMSFRNSSNGYYGGSLEESETTPDNVPEIFDDYFNV